MRDTVYGCPRAARYEIIEGNLIKEASDLPRSARTTHAGRTTPGMDYWKHGRLVKSRKLRYRTNESSY